MALMTKSSLSLSCTFYRTTLIIFHFLFRLCLQSFRLFCVFVIVTFINHVVIFSDEFDDYLLYNCFFTGLQKVSGAHGVITIFSTTHSFKFSEIMTICYICDILVLFPFNTFTCLQTLHDSLFFLVILVNISLIYGRQHCR